MARRKQAPATATDELFSLEPDSSPSTENATTSSLKKRISVPLTEDGKVDLASMRPTTQASLKAALAGVGLSSGTSDPGEAKERLETRKANYEIVVGPIYAVLGALESLIAAQRLKLPYDEAHAILQYSEADVAILTDPTATVLAKRLPESFAWAEETALALILLSIHQEKMALLKDASERAKTAAQMTHVPRENKSIPVEAESLQ